MSGVLDEYSVDTSGQTSVMHRLSRLPYSGENFTAPPTNDAKVPGVAVMNILDLKSLRDSSRLISNLQTLSTVSLPVLDTISLESFRPFDIDHAVRNSENLARLAR